MPAARANWKGYLRLSLVSCPIALYPATSESEKVRFNGRRRSFVVDTGRSAPDRLDHVDRPQPIHVLAAQGSPGDSRLLFRLPPQQPHPPRPLLTQPRKFYGTRRYRSPPRACHPPHIELMRFENGVVTPRLVIGAPVS